MAYHKKVPRKPAYVYTLSQNEIDYCVYRNPDAGAYEALHKAIQDNHNFCLQKTERTLENKCMCQEFLNSTKEGPCSCNLFFKRLRTEKEKTQYLKNVPINEAAEDKLLKKLAKEEAAAEKAKLAIVGSAGEEE
jgi:hypothetical protein